MSEYLVLIYDNEARFAEPQPDTMQRMMDGHVRFQANNGAAIKGGNALQPTGTATSIRRDGSGEVTITDGPFAETKEALGGYYLIEAGDLDEAIAIAREIPTLEGGVEVRPIRVFD
jgi:hypothetical protein